MKEKIEKMPILNKKQLKVRKHMATMVMDTYEIRAKINQIIDKLSQLEEKKK